jgi:penicillin-binding protein 1C
LRRTDLARPDGLSASQQRQHCTQATPQHRRAAGAFPPVIESPRTESFLAGTETGEIRLVATNSTDQQVHAKILYPTNGTIIAMDPDIPVNHQRVQLSAKGSEQIAWAMDGNDIGWY